jgi:hypothetical protein
MATHLPRRKPTSGCKIPPDLFLPRMLVIRRLDDGKRSYTAMFLPGQPAKIFPTSNHEHARILQIYKQDRAYPDVLNDFTDYGLGHDTLPDSSSERAR